MARIIARRDAEASYAYFSSGDNYPLPLEARDLIKRNSGDYSGVTQEWRVHLDRGAAVIAALRISGHEVIPVEAGAKPAPKQRVVGPKECKLCGHPYAADAAAQDRLCVECGGALVLVPPQVNLGAGLAGGEG